MARHFGIISVRHSDDPSPQCTRRGREVSCSPMGTSRWGKKKKRNTQGMGNPLNLPTFSQTRTKKKEPRRFDHLRRAEECSAVTRPTARHDQRRGRSNHVRYLAALFLNGVSGGI